MTGTPGRDRPILLTGGTGQVGFELARKLARIGDIISPSRSELDLENPENVRSFVRALKPGLIVNAAAYTGVDRAESDSVRAGVLNEDLPGVLAGEAKRLDAVLVHYSTDYVFDGTKGEPYSEEDVPRPLSVYGRTKLAGEKAVLASGAAALIFRCEWIYARRGKNFLLTMLRLGKEKPSLSIVSDQRGSPTWARAIASATARIISCGQESKSALSYFEQNSGVYHMAAGGSTTWFDFAEAIFERSHVPAPRLTPINTEQYPTPAKRPMNSIFDTSKLARTFGVTLTDWQSQLDQAMTTEP